MQTETIQIEVYDRREKVTATIYVEQLTGNTFKAVENEFFLSGLTFGTEFETKINGHGKHEITRIINESKFITRRFFLTSQFKESEYRLLGDEIMKQGGFWQVDFGSIATINLPENSTLDIDAIFKTFDFKPTEIIE